MKNYKSFYFQQILGRMKYIIGITITVVLSISYTQVLAQTAWSLERCLEYARQNNLQIQAAQYNASNADIDVKQSAQSRYPNLSGNTNYSYNFGRNIDPTTNDFVPTNLGYNSINLNTSLPLYAGGRIKQRYAQALLSRQEWTSRVEQAIEDVELEVTLAYLNVLFELERKQNAEEQLAISESQLDRVEKMIEVETSPESEKYEWIAQVHADKQIIRTSENAIENNIFQLKNLLNLEASESFAIDIPGSMPIPDNVSLDYEFEAVFKQIVNRRPDIRAFEYNEHAAEKEVLIAKSFYLPSFGIGASLSTNFSSLAQTNSDFATRRITKEGVFINGESVLYEEERSIPGKNFRTPYFDQLNQNLGFGVGVQLSIPIYNRGQARADVRRAENAYLLAKNNNQQSVKNLELQIQQILGDLRNAQAQYEAGETRVEFLQNAFENTQQRYNLGMSNNYELLDAQNRYNQAVNDLTIAKYDLIFRSKIIDFYLGKKIHLGE